MKFSVCSLLQLNFHLQLKYLGKYFSEIYVFAKLMFDVQDNPYSTKETTLFTKNKLRKEKEKENTDVSFF